MAAVPDRPREGDRPGLWIDVTCGKGRRNGRIVSRIISVATIAAVGVDADGRREALGLDAGPSEAEPFRTAFLRKPARRCRRGVKLAISAAREGVRAAAPKTPDAAWRRRVHVMRNDPAHAGKSETRAE